MKKTDPGYARWRAVEDQRVWRIANEKNPIVKLPVRERVMPATYSLEEAFWHKLTCDCACCQGFVAKAIKQVRLDMRPVPPAVKGLESRLPRLPDPLLRHLQAVEAEALSTGDWRTSQRLEQPLPPFDLGYLDYEGR
jgi:hypothetical protein